MSEVVVRIGVVDVNAKEHVDAFPLVPLQDVLHPQMQSRRKRHASQQNQGPPKRRALSVPRQRGGPGEQQSARSKDSKRNQKPPKAGVGSHKGVPTFVGAKQDGQHGKDEGRDPEQQDVAAEPFAVQDEHKAPKNQDSTCIGLKQNQSRGQGDDR